NYYTMSGMPSNSFGRQMRDNFSKSLGFSLNVPIFDAFNTRNQIRQARAQKLSAELELERQESNLLKTIRQAHSQAEGAEAQYRAGETAVTSAKAALDAMTEKFTYGRANATEWEQARSNYITTLSQQVQAKYEMILRNRILNFYNKVR
ncbi:TolC family protein, partial [uncultured Duncaniella sp.]